MFLFCTTFLACPNGTDGQTPEDLIPRDLLFKQKDKTAIHLSLDGKTVFYLKNGVEGAESELFYVGAKSPLVERSITFAGEVADYRPVHSGGILAVVKRDTAARAFFVTLASQKIRELDSPPFHEMRVVHLSERFPNKVAVEVEMEDESKSGIYTLDILSGKMRLLGKMEGFGQLFFDQNFGKVAALQRNEQGGNSILRFHEGEWKTVREHPWHPEMFMGGMSRIVSVDLDGKTIYATDNFGKDKSSLVSIDVASGEVTELLADPDADILPYAPTLDATGRPQAVVSRWAEIRRHVLDESVRADFDFLEKNMAGSVSFVEGSTDQNVWLVRSMNGGPYHYFHFDRRAKKLTPLFNDYSHLEGYDLATRTTRTVSVRDGMKFPVYLYVPPGMAKADGTPKVPLPTIIYVHGGPWPGLKYWDRWAVDRHLQLLANRGYVVVQAEFRGTLGLGKKVCDAGNGEWGGAMHNDLVDIAEWAIEAGIANPKRLGIWGWSYGGYAVNFALAAEPGLFACGLSVAGVGDLKTFAEGRSQTWRNLVADPDTPEGMATLEAHSPTTFLDETQAPLLLSCGGQDSRVPPSQSTDFAKKLEAAGKPVVFIEYPDEPHSFLQPKSWVSFWAVAEDMLHRHVGGRKQMDSGDMAKSKMQVVCGEEYVRGLE